MTANDGNGAAHPACRRAALILACAVAVPIVPFVLVGELPGERWLMATGASSVAFACAGAALLAADLLLPIPSSLVGTLLGHRLGAGVGFVAAFVGLSLGALAGYALGRLLPARFAPTTEGTFSAAALTLSRPVPVLAEALALTAGATRVPLPIFALATGVGNAVYAGALAFAGANWLPRDLAGPGLVVPLLLPVGAYALWRWTTRKRKG